MYGPILTEEPMESAVELFDRESVIPELDSTDKYGAIRELIRRARVCREIRDPDFFEDAVISREHEYTTGLGHGVAVAHGKAACVKKPFLALGISHKGIEFDSVDGAPVNFLFLVGSAPGNHAEYLSILSLLARVIRNEAFRRSLSLCGTAQDVAERLNRAFQDTIERRGLSETLTA